MVYKKIFVDSDIILDLLLVRKPFNRVSEILLQEGLNIPLNLCTSTLVFANTYYMIAKSFGKLVAKEQLKVMSSIIQMLPFEPENLILALDSDHSDFEDTVQFFIAEKHNCDLIISRNIKHYKKFDLPVLTAEQFLNQL